MDSRNFTIGILSTTAIILLAAVLVFQAPQPTVLADGMAIIKDDYVLSVGAATRNDEDLVYIIDSVTERLGVYRFNTSRKQIELVQGISMAEMRSSADPSAKNPTPPKPKRP